LFVGQPNKRKKGYGKKLTCWICGGTGYGLKGCTESVNQASTEQRKNALKEKQKNNQGEHKNNKWAELTEAEKGHQVINGKPLFYVRCTKGLHEFLAGFKNSS
jgi:hypothetical protein